MAISSPQNRSMAHSLTKSTDRRNFRSSLLLLLGLFLLGLVVISQLGENGVVPWLRLQNKVQELKKSTADLEYKNQELEARIEAIKNDPATLEKIAREKLDMQQAKEEVLMVLPPGSAPKQGASRVTGDTQP